MREVLKEDDVTNNRTFSDASPVLQCCRSAPVAVSRDALATLVRTDTPETFVAMVHQALTSRPDCWWG